MNIFYLHHTHFNRIILSILLAVLAGLVSCRGGQVAPQAIDPDRPRILYLAPDEEGNAQLFVVPLDGGEARQLTREAYDVLDYALLSDGTIIAYTVLTEDGSGDLWAIGSDGRRRRRLLDCGGAACSQPAWAAGGRRLLYTRREAAQDPRLWQLDLDSGVTTPFFDDPQMTGYGARFSPDGHRFSYFSPTDKALRVYNVETGASSIVFNQVRENAVWSPRGDALYLADVGLVGERYTVQLLRIDMETGGIANISGDQEVDDASPAPSPDGQWLAFGRKSPRVAMGRQLWLMRPDGSKAHYLTDDPKIHHAPLSWSPDGRYLLFQRVVVTELDAQPAVWVYDSESEDFREIASPGRQGTWLAPP